MDRHQTDSERSTPEKSTTIGNFAGPADDPPTDDMHFAETYQQTQPLGPGMTGSPPKPDEVPGTLMTLADLKALHTGLSLDLAVGEFDEVFARPLLADDSTHKAQLSDISGLCQILNHDRPLGWIMKYAPEHIRDYMKARTTTKEGLEKLEEEMKRLTGKLNSRMRENASLAVCQLVWKIGGKSSWHENLMEFRTKPDDEKAKCFWNWAKEETYGKCLVAYGDYAKTINFCYIFLKTGLEGVDAHRQRNWQAFFHWELAAFVTILYYARYHRDRPTKSDDSILREFYKAWDRDTATAFHHTFKPGGGSRKELPLFREKNKHLRMPRASVFDQDSEDTKETVEV